MEVWSPVLLNQVCSFISAFIMINRRIHFDVHLHHPTSLRSRSCNRTFRSDFRVLSRFIIADYEMYARISLNKFNGYFLCFRVFYIHALDV